MLISDIHPHESTIGMLTKKDAQLESCEVSLIWGKMRTPALETALQVAERVLQRGSGVRSISK